MQNSIKNLSNDIYLRIDKSSTLSVPPHTSKAKDQKLKLLLKMDNSTKKTTSPFAAKTPLQHPSSTLPSWTLRTKTGRQASQSSLETSLKDLEPFQLFSNKNMSKILSKDNITALFSNLEKLDMVPNIVLQSLILGSDSAISLTKKKPAGLKVKVPAGPLKGLSRVIVKKRLPSSSPSLKFSSRGARASNRSMTIMLPSGTRTCLLGTTI